MSVAMDIMRALDPSGLAHFKINLDKPVVVQREVSVSGPKTGEIWTIKVVPFEKAETSRKAFNQLFDNKKVAKSWVVENKQEAIDVLQEIYDSYQEQLEMPFDAHQLGIDDLPAVGRYSILIHVLDIY